MPEWEWDGQVSFKGRLTVVGRAVGQDGMRAAVGERDVAAHPVRPGMKAGESRYARRQAQPVSSSSGRKLGDGQQAQAVYSETAGAKRKRWRGDGDVGRIGEGLEGCRRAEMGWSVRS